MSAALVNRSLSTLRTELEFLRDSNVITENFYGKIIQHLPDRYTQGALPVDFRESGPLLEKTTQPPPAVVNVSSAPQEKQGFQSYAAPPPQPPQPEQPPRSNDEYYEALYNYKPQQAEDLELHVGDKLRVFERLSPDWYKGENLSTKGTGVFPSNYVKKLDGYEPRGVEPQLPVYQPPASAPYQMQPPPSNTNTNNMPFPPPSVGYQPYQSTQQPPPQHYQSPNQPPPQQQAVAQQPAEQQQPSKASGAAKKFGSKLGNAAIFGAGATIGSEIVHSIF